MGAIFIFAKRRSHLPLLAGEGLGWGQKPRAEFAEIEGKLGRLLEKFGPSGVGGSADLASRLLGSGLTATLGQQVALALLGFIALNPSLLHPSPEQSRPRHPFAAKITKCRKSL